ncbi:MAG: SRPBCC family protein [Actinobacteria bacterium]|nr:SRPBCC family protein [Actinomycetota bacterium]
MADQVSERIRVDASAAHCFDVATDFEQYPSWARDVKEAKVLDRDAQGRGTTVEFRAAAMGRTIRYVLTYDYSDAPHAFSWKLLEGDMLRKLDGRYQFDAEGDGAARVTYDLAVDLAVPLPGLIKRRAAGLIMGNALKELKRNVEKS